MSTEEKAPMHPYERPCEQTGEGAANNAASDYAAGYAEAVADVVADLENQWFELATTPRPGKALKLLRAAIVRLKIGAHVGAAKKGVSNG